MSDYMSYVATPFFVLDKIVIQLYSRIFELRLCVLLDNKYWVAKIGDKPENCNIKLAFFGKLRFEDTVRIPKKLPPLYLNPLVVVDEDDNGNQKQSQHCTGCAPSEVVDLSSHSNDAHISAASTATQQCEPPEIIVLSTHSKESCISGAITSTPQCADLDIIDLSMPSKDSQVAGASNLNKDSQESGLPVKMGATLVSANLKSDLQLHVVLHRMPLDEKIKKQLERMKGAQTFNYDSDSTVGYGEDDFENEGQDEVHLEHEGQGKRDIQEEGITAEENQTTDVNIEDLLTAEDNFDIENNARTEAKVDCDEGRESVEFVADVETPQPKMKLLLKEFNLKKHKKNVNAIKMRCSVCQVKLYGYKEMNNYMTEEPPDFKVKCIYCAHTFENILARNRHHK